MSRFYAPKENIKGNLIYIDGEEARHILNVMRLKENERVIVFDGTGKEYTGFIKEVHRRQGLGGQAKAKSLVVEILTTKIPKIDRTFEITLAQSVPKKEKMDYIVEKATELGVDRIVPIVSERTVVRFAKELSAVHPAPAPRGGVNRIARWERIARQAAKQCARPDPPEIKNIQKFYDAVDEINNFDLSLMACLSEDTVNLNDAISDFEGGKIIVFIGPEGDFTSAEIEMAKDKGCKLVSLGRSALRSETAALFVLSILNYEFTS